MTAPLVARKTITTIQAGSVYRDRWPLNYTPPVGSTVRRVFFDSAGAELVSIDGTVAGRIVEFREPYSGIEMVPNGAGFYTYIHHAGDGAADEQMICYGTVFRRELTFPHSPAVLTSTVVKEFSDSFQRPQGAVGGRWKTLVGEPYIFDNGADANTVGPRWSFFDRYFCYYYQPFNADTVELAISVTDKGPGKTIVTLCQNSAASSFLYLGFNSGEWSELVPPGETIELGYGTGPDVGPIGGTYDFLEPQIPLVDMPIPSLPSLTRFILRYDDTTGELAVYNSDKTVKHASWVDTGNVVPHGRGYRYFGVGGNAGLLNSGVQLAYINAQGTV